MAKKKLPGLLKRRIKIFYRNCFNSISYYLYQKGKLYPSKHNLVIFICKGNISRSAFAEYYMKTKTSGLSVKIESFGLDVDQGKFSPPEAVEMAREFGVDLSTNVSRKLTSADIEKADLIIPMEYEQYVRTVAMASDKRNSVRLLRESW